MNGDRAIPGLWWFPENTAQRWIGTLRLGSAKSPRLEFTVSNDSGFKTPETVPVVHGCDQHGKPITLLDLGRDSSGAALVLTEFVYSGGYAILGTELKSAELFHANTLTLYMQHLFEWAALSGFQERGLGLQRSTIRYIRPDVMTFSVDEDRRVDVVSTGSPWSTPRECGVREDAFLKFSSTKGFSFRDCGDVVTAIRHLLHFAILEPVYPTRTMCGKISGDTPQSIEICSGLDREPIESEFQAAGWMFQFCDVQGQFGEFMAKWLRFVSDFEEALNPYFTTVYHPLPDEVQHICLTQALEAYHGIKNQSLHRREFGFEKRIDELALAHQTSLPGMFDDPVQFAATTLANRNYYTHHNPDWLNKGVVSGAELYRLNEKLRLLFQLCILTEIGVPAQRFHRLHRQLATHVVEYSGSK